MRRSGFYEFPVFELGNSFRVDEIVDEIWNGGFYRFVPVGCDLFEVDFEDINAL